MAHAAPLQGPPSGAGSFGVPGLADEDFRADEGPRSVAQLKMLQSLARQLNQLNDVRQIGEAITGELRTLIDYHNCRVHLIDDAGTTLVPIAFRGELSEYQGETFDALVMPVGHGITGRVAQLGESYYTPDADHDPYAQTIPGTPEVEESILVVPLRYGDRVIGTVALSKLGLDQFDDEDMRLLEVLGSHAAVAIENARLLDRERRAARTSQALLDLSQGLTRVHDPESVLTEALARTPALVPCFGAFLYTQLENGDFRLAAWSPEDRAPERPMKDVPASLASRFLLSIEEPFVIPREAIASVPPEYLIYDTNGEHYDSLVCPIRWEDGLAVILLTAPTPDSHFSDQDRHLTRGIADITSLALGNASRFRQLQDTAEHLRALDELKNTFLDAVSHELRTPLSAVLGIALTLNRRDVELSQDDVNDLLGRLAANARKLDRLLSDLLELDRLARGITSPKRRSTDIAETIRVVVESSERFDRSSVTIEAQPVVVRVDPAKVERIVENLLANAARHTPEGSRIWVRAWPSDGGVVIAIEDDGPGVAAELREAIFEPFRQGPQRRKHSPGVGIGLSLVARFAELHGGRAWVEDREGGGASFRVFLPDGVEQNQAWSDEGNADESGDREGPDGPLHSSSTTA